MTSRGRLHIKHALLRGKSTHWHQLIYSFTFSLLDTCFKGDYTESTFQLPCWGPQQLCFIVGEGKGLWTPANPEDKRGLWASLTISSTFMTKHLESDMGKLCSTPRSWKARKPRSSDLIQVRTLYFLTMCQLLMYVINTLELVLLWSCFTDDPRELGALAKETEAYLQTGHSRAHYLWCPAA